MSIPKDFRDFEYRWKVVENKTYSVYDTIVDQNWLTQQSQAHAADIAAAMNEAYNMGKSSITDAPQAPALTQKDVEANQTGRGGP
jgi:hypothetical protein